MYRLCVNIEIVALVFIFARQTRTKMDNYKVYHNYSHEAWQMRWMQIANYDVDIWQICKCLVNAKTVSLWTLSGTPRQVTKSNTDVAFKCAKRMLWRTGRKREVAHALLHRWVIIAESELQAGKHHIFLLSLWVISSLGSDFHLALIASLYNSKIINSLTKPSLNVSNAAALGDRLNGQTHQTVLNRQKNTPHHPHMAVAGRESPSISSSSPPFPQCTSYE